MEETPFFVEFHHFLWIFTIFYRFSRFTHFCRDLYFVAIYALFPQFFFGQNSLLRNTTRFLHVWGIVNWFGAQMCSNMVICFFTGHWFKIIFHKNAQEENWFICMLLQLIVYSKSYHFPHKMHRSRRVIEGDDAVFWQLFWNAIFS